MTSIVWEPEPSLALSASFIGDARAPTHPAPLAISRAHWHAAARRRSWLILRVPEYGLL